MTKHNGKYYLQYAGPGTEFKSYSDGVYVSDKPLGPFTIANIIRLLISLKVLQQVQGIAAHSRIRTATIGAFLL